MQTSTADSTALPKMQIYRIDLPDFPNRASVPGDWGKFCLNKRLYLHVGEAIV